MKRLKIAQQMIIVLILAVLIPSIVIGVVISNVSQQSIRRQFNYSATLLSQFIGESIEQYLENSNEKLRQIADAIPYFYMEADKNDYLNEISKKYGEFKNFEIINKNKVLGDFVFDINSLTLKFYAPIDNQNYLSATISVDQLKRVVAKRFENEKRQIYVLDIDNTLISSNTPDTKDLPNIIKKLPQKKEIARAELFGDVKNQPMAYYRLEKPQWTVVVSTTAKLTDNTINLARFRIILAISLSALFIIFVISLYTYYLYINIRQLFKGIIAISKGSYERKIHLIKNIFTPHEIVFLAREFNFMAKKVAQSHKELYAQNLELERLGQFRANLLSSISHEFRTPLTSIIGYSSRLLRQDIKIDEATVIKSLKVIKQQAQRLTRMIEDVLVVPDIEDLHLHLNLQDADIAKLVESSILYTNCANSQFNILIPSDLKKVRVDVDRMTQILVNLFDNAIKYNQNDGQILVNAQEIDGKVVLTIFNQHSKIEQEVLDKLFDKFERLDCELTRTTSGCGLGLFIVKGLANAMNIDVFLTSTDEGFMVTLVFNEEEPEEEENDDDEE